MSLGIIDQLLQWCCRICDNFFAGILLFAVTVKAALIPLSLWCQWNSITMVRILPQINELKTRFFGDGELLAEEERKLFKKNGYHPFLSILPLAVQILILLSLLAAIEKQLGGIKNFAALMPWKDGGWTYIMPAFAGLSAILFSWSQNHLHPLQKEQGKTQQFITNSITVLISAVFGVFVITGVSFYWAISNLLSIVSQIVCNMIIPPEKFVDYELLKKSKLIYNGVRDSVSRKLTSAQKMQEKVDRKRFFSVANKHIVFYSEGSGFYKYFEQLIEYLLENSNCTIHYVTSDPNDQIFEKSKLNPRLRGYFQGPTKLISLFMRMDADIVVMTTPDLDNFHLKRSYVKKDVEYIYVDHAISSTHMTYREHAFDNFDTIFCVCQNQVDELRQMENLYHTRAKNLVQFGYPLLDTLLQRYAQQNNVSPSLSKKIMIAPSWQEGNIFDGAYKKILNALTGHGFSIILRAHPEYIKRFQEKWDAVCSFCETQNFADVEIERDFSSNDTIFNSDLVITDWSGIAYEFAYSVLKPVLFIDTPMKIINPNYKKLNMEPINITMRSKVGINLDINNLDATLDMVNELLKSPEKYRKKILAARSQYVFNIGASGAAGGHYILDKLIEKQTAKQQSK